MIFRVDPLASEPIFSQLVFQVKAAVAKGELEAGARLPSVRALARSVSINPNTVVKAYDVLQHDGVVVRRQGAGCFVTGRTSDKADGERQRRLAALVEHVVTEAVHLGFDAAQVRQAVDEALSRVRFGKSGKDDAS